MLKRNDAVMQSVGLENSVREKSSEKRKKSSENRNITDTSSYEEDSSADSSPESSSLPDPSPDSSSKVDDNNSRWSKCPTSHKALSLREEARLATAFTDLVKGKHLLDNYPERKYYCFVQRVCKAYAYMSSRRKDDLHLEREIVAEAAVSLVHGQIQPPSDKPHSGTI